MSNKLKVTYYFVAEEQFNSGYECHAAYTDYIVLSVPFANQADAIKAVQLHNHNPPEWGAICIISGEMVIKDFGKVS